MASRAVRKAGRKVCPRCGPPYSYLERRRTAHNTYVYAVHVTYEGRKRKVKKCYLGAEAVYKYVGRVHGDIPLRLRGMHDRERVFDYLERLVSYLESNADGIDIETLKELRERLEWFLSYLDGVIYQKSAE